MAGAPDVELFTALNLSAPGPHPSISCAQWSGDGQLVVCTKNAIFILTPDLGVNFENPSLLKTDRRNLQERGIKLKEPGLDIGWHRNLIELDRNVTHPWAYDTQVCGALTLGTLDISWRSVVISPGNLSNVSTGSGSLLVVMNTNSELTLWYAAKNHLKEAWTKMQDITSTLKELPTPQERLPQDRHLPLKVLQAQVNCMTWSQQSDFGVRPSLLVDGSILALGNRAGSIILMRYDGEQKVVPIRVLQVADEWIVRLAWSSWKSYQPYHTEAYLACALANGAVVLIHVCQRLEAASTSFSPTFTVQAEYSVLDLSPSGPDGSGITALAWIERLELPHEKPTLFYAKPGVFHFYRISVSLTEAITSVPNGEILGAVEVQRQGTSVDSSPFYPVSGYGRVADMESDILIVTLFDGSIHVVRDACTSPNLDSVGQPQNIGPPDSEANTDGINSTQLSHLVRRAIVQAEGSPLRYVDVGRISGAVDFDGLGTILWLHETNRPTDFSYKHEAKHNSMLVVARIWQNPREHDLLLSLISRAFERPGSTLGHSPSSILRPILLHLCQRKTFDTIWPRVLPLLPPDPDAFDYANGLPTWSRGIDEEIKRAIKRNLAVELYGWEAFHSLRLRLAIADYCWKMSPNEEIREQFGKAAQGLLSSISHRFMRILVRHLAALIESLTEQELPFLMRVIVQSLLAGSPEDLTTEAHALSEATKTKFASVAPEAFGLTETCPACRSTIPLENLLTAVCPNGHAWARCSITSFVLATPLVRTCTGCTRKAFLAPSSRTQGSGASNTVDPVGTGASPPALAELPATSNLWIPDAGRSWFVDELLEAARFCLYCGNRFVRSTIINQPVATSPTSPITAYSSSALKNRKGSTNRLNVHDQD